MPADAAAAQAALSARLGERLNPVLIKDVRAALRGRVFAVGFLVVLLLGLLASTIALIVGAAFDQGLSGTGYLAGVMAAFTLGSHGFVPFSAMASMGAEHDEGALEQLQLSGLSAGRIVAGKLAAAAAQAALICAAFLPFLAFATLLPGVDPLGFAQTLCGSFVIALTLSSVGILFGAVLKQRWTRVIGFVLLALILLVATEILGGLALAVARGAGMGIGATESLLLTLGACLVVGGLCCVGAALRLSHAEENRSSGLRIVSSLALALACLAAVWADNPGGLMAWLITALVSGTPAMLLGVTEPARLPRAVLTRAVRRGPWGALLAPWLPGGGRAVLYVLLHLAAVAVVGVVAAARLGSPHAWLAAGAVALFELYLASALLLPSGALARWLHVPGMQLLARLAILLLPLVATLVPAFGRFLRPSSAVEPFQHAGNPAYLSASLLSEGRIEDPPAVLLHVGVLLAALALNAPRVLGALREVPRERARRAARVRAAPLEVRRA
jgi:hypothetical protein